MLPDATIDELARALREGRTSSRELTEQALARAGEAGGRHVFTRTFDEAALAQADAADRLRAQGVVPSPLAGLPVSIKDLFDVQGHETRAGSRALAGSGPAARDAVVVARLRAAGAVLVGHTNMTEFAYSGIGLNPHYGTPGNPHDPARIPGGSSSGAAVSVAGGMAAMGLGTDTGGSVRIPAALCGLAGFKPTQWRVPLDGSVPLSSTLDSIGPIARTIRCCAVADAILAGAPEHGAPAALPLAGLRLAVPQSYVLDDMDEAVSEAFAEALTRLSEAGARIEEAGFENLLELGALFEGGGFTAAESFHWHRRLLAEKRELYDPRVRGRIERGAAMPASDYMALQDGRAAAIAEMRRRMRPWDALLIPTVPIVAPRFDELDDDADFTRLNLLVLRNSTVANMLGLCAASLPCQAEGALPVGLTVMAGEGQDERLLAMAAAIEDLLRGGA
ncbi:amidase (plasmid) [Geminicoccaceae bacterium 1502E]|nr:amidase [Geminicoccaceae bacterium 1502E]